jgi:hypothetical protein
MNMRDLWFYSSNYIEGLKEIMKTSVRIASPSQDMNAVQEN